MLEKPWWELWPGREEHELRALEAAGIRYRIEQRLPANNFLRLKLEFLRQGKPVVLFADFPPLYPFFRPEVYAEPGSFSRHQNPLGGNLCLLGRRSENWNSDWTLAELLTSQFGKLETAATTKNQMEREALEEPLGEPASQFYAYLANSIILLDDFHDIGKISDSGSLTILVESTFSPIKMRGKVLEIRAKTGKKLFSSAGHPWQGKEVQASWVRVPSPPFVNDPLRFEQRLLDEKIILPFKYSSKVGEWFIDIVGLLVEEEVQQGIRGDGWMFLVRSRHEKTQQSQTHLVRAGRAGFSDFSVRIPSLAFLRQKCVTIIGLGSIGAPIAIELARAGIGHLCLVDFDFVDPGSVVRWPIGLSASGLQKTVAIKDFINRNYPFTKVETLEYRFGLPRFGTEDSLEKLLSHAALIIDATTEFGVHQFLSWYSTKTRTPFLLAYLTPGGYGGLVARFEPAKNFGCWSCLQTALYSDRSIPLPLALENSEIQPPGCGERTAIFPGFDAVEISLETMRMAVSTLSEGLNENYPMIDWNVAIAEFRSPNGKIIPPSWKTYVLDRICPSCK